MWSALKTRGNQIAVQAHIRNYKCDKQCNKTTMLSGIRRESQGDLNWYKSPTP